MNLALVTVSAGIAVPLVVVIWRRQRLLLEGLERLLLEVETETRATAHKVGVESDDFEAAAARWAP